MLLRSVMASAGCQPAAANALTISGLEPTSPTLIGSPGMSCVVRVTMGVERIRLVFVVLTQTVATQIGQADR